MSKAQLAEVIGVSAQAITNYEDEVKSPLEETIQRMTFALQFPRSYFYAPDISLVDAETVSFRARRTLKARERDKAISTGTLATEIISVDFRRRFKFPALDLPDMPDEDPETAAKILRRHWKLGTGPIHNMIQLLESKGIEVYFLDEPVHTLDAFSLWRNNLPYVLLNQYKGAGDRARFDTAHELGHLILHRRTDLYRKDAEMEADRFASAFLLPEEQFRLESPRMPVLNQYLPLKRRWQVSIQAMIRRGYDLDIYSRWYYEQAMKQLSSLGWRMDEPNGFARENSLAHLLAFDRLAAKQINAFDYAAQLYLPYDDIAEIIPAAKSYVPNEEIAVALVQEKEETKILRLF